MELQRGDIWWAELPEALGSGPGFRRPVLVVSANAFNRSRLQTCTIVALTSNVRLLDAPGNVLVPAKAAGLPRDSVANVTQVFTLSRHLLTERVSRLPGRIVAQIDDGLRLALDL